MSEVTGKLIVKNESQTFGEKGFTKRDAVVETDEKYPQKILIEFTQDNCDLLDQFNVGDEVTVKVNLRGREWINPQGEAKYFNSLNGWSIAKAGGGETANPQASAKPIAQVDDDLPF